LQQGGSAELPTSPGEPGPAGVGGVASAEAGAARPAEAVEGIEPQPARDRVAVKIAEAMVMDFTRYPFPGNTACATTSHRSVGRCASRRLQIGAD
jgi:hypothetical protein